MKKKFKYIILLIYLLSFLSVNSEECFAVKASHILLRTENEANQVLDYINKGVDFGELARGFSLCSSKKEDGDLGYFYRGQMVKPFEEKAFSMQKGEISEPVKTQFGWHIIKVVDKLCK